MGSILENWISAEIYRSNIQRGMRGVLQDYSNIKQGIKKAYIIKFNTILNIKVNKLGELSNFIHNFYSNNGLFLAQEYFDVKYLNSKVKIRVIPRNKEITVSKDKIATLNPLIYMFTLRRNRRPHMIFRILLFLLGILPGLFNEIILRDYQRLNESLIISLKSINNKIHIIFEIRKNELIQYKEEYEPFIDILKAIDKFYSNPVDYHAFKNDIYVKNKTDINQKKIKSNK
jgi:hypothetical protein